VPKACGERLHVVAAVFAMLFLFIYEREKSDKIFSLCLSKNLTIKKSGTIRSDINFSLSLYGKMSLAPPLLGLLLWVPPPVRDDNGLPSLLSTGVAEWRDRNDLLPEA
jgi:hypothetical protein